MFPAPFSQSYLIQNIYMNISMTQSVMIHTRANAISQIKPFVVSGHCVCYLNGTAGDWVGSSHKSVTLALKTCSALYNDKQLGLGLAIYITIDVVVCHNDGIHNSGPRYTLSCRV